MVPHGEFAGHLQDFARCSDVARHLRDSAGHLRALSGLAGHDWPIMHD
jgi:hypothetical protein